jgi:hypothetical protein
MGLFTPTSSTSGLSSAPSEFSLALPAFHPFRAHDRDVEVKIVLPEVRSASRHPEEPCHAAGGKERMDHTERQSRLWNGEADIAAALYEAASKCAMGYVGMSTAVSDSAWMTRWASANRG